METSMKRLAYLLFVSLLIGCGGGGGGDTNGGGTNPPPDTTPPAITMLGANPASVLVGAVYVDAGATALDDKDGNITNRIATSGLPINTNAVGSYLVTYTVSDQAGNQAVPVSQDGECSQCSTSA